MATDIQTLIGEIAARNHIRIEDSDPIFAVCTINRLMMDEAFEALMVRVRAAIGEFEASARSVDAHAGKILADQVRISASAWKSEIAHDIERAGLRSTEMIERVHLAHSKPAMLRCAALGLFAGLFFFGCGIWFGIFIR